MSGLPRLFKLFLLALLGIVLIGFGFAWWLIVDGDWIRTKTEQLVTDMTGRPFSIRGELDLDIGLDPTVALTDLHLGNAPWAEQHDMATVERLAVSIDLMSALSDQLVVHFIEVDGVALMLAENEAGEVNWNLSPERDESPKEPLTELPLVVERFEVNDFRLGHVSPARSKPLDFSMKRFALNQVSPHSAQVAAAGRLGELPLTLNGRIDGLRAFAIGGGIQNELRMELGDIVLDIRGKVEEVRGWRGIDLALNLSGPEFAWILEQAALPTFSNGPFDFALLVDGHDGGTRIQLDGDLGALELFADGQVDNPLSPGNGVLDFDIKGPDLRGLGEALGVEKLVAAPYQLEGDIRMNEGQIEVRQLDSVIGEDRSFISGSIGAWPALAGTEVDIRFEGPDFSVWGPVMGIDGLRQKAFEFNGHFSAVDSEAILTDSELLVGGHRLAVAGSLGTPPEFIDASLTVDVAITDIGSIAVLPGHEDLPDEALRVTGGLERDGDGILLENLKAELGSDLIVLDGRVALEPSLKGSEIRAHTEIVSLGGLAKSFGFGALPDLPLTFFGVYRISGIGLNFHVADGSLGSIEFGFSGNLPQLESIDRLETEFRISTPSLTAFSMLAGGQELPDQPLSASGTLAYQDRSIGLRDIGGKLGDTSFEVDGQVMNAPDFDGSEVRISISSSNIHQLYRNDVLDRLPATFAVDGRLRYQDNSIGMTAIEGALGETSFAFEGELGGFPEFTDSQIRFSVSSSNLQALYSHKSLEGLPATFAVKGRVEYRGESIGMTGIEGRLGDASFEVDGHVADWPELNGSEVRFNVAAADFHQLIKHELLETLPGRFAASGRVSKDAAGYRFDDMQFDVGGTHVELGGTVDDLPGVSALDLNVSVAGNNLSELDGLVKRPLPDWNFHLEAGIRGRTEELQIDSLNLGLGPSDISGDLQLALQGQRSIAGKLHSDLLDLSWLGGEAEDKAVADTTEEPADTKGPLFPNTPILERHADRIMVDLAVSVDRLLTKTSQLEAIRVGIHQDADVLRIDPIHFRGQSGGSISGSFAVNQASGTPRMTLGLEGRDMRVGLAAAEGQDPATFPPWDVSIQLDGEGTTYHDLAASLNGKARIFLRAGRVTNAGLGLVMSDLLFELFQMLNPYAEKKEYTNLDCGVIALNAEGGLFTSIVPVILQTEELTIISGGTIDLNSEILDLGFNTKVRKGIGISAGMVVNPFIKLGGDLSSPDIELDPEETAVKGTIAVATVGLSLVGRALWDRFFSTRDPCGEAIKRIDELEAKKMP